VINTSEGNNTLLIVLKLEKLYIKTYTFSGDGMVALAMAIGGYLTDNNKGSVYDRRGILTI